MRFVITGEWTRNRLLQTIVTLFSLYVIGLWLTNALLYFSKMSLTASSVIDYYLGSEERFLSPRSYQGLLEVSHFHLFAMGMLLLVLTHLMLFVPLRDSTKAWLIIVPFLSAILDEGAGWLVRYGSPNFAYAKIAGFLLLETSLAVLVAVSLWSVFAGSQRNYDGQPSESVGEAPDS
ncbi:MAG: hypothetical protein IH974_05915 [Myxococcales bacterium]|nr:hypothetical protein [Myxococcales bacterium]